jgi:DNA invertase Pin-like site-specific DNA recombinase
MGRGGFSSMMQAAARCDLEVLFVWSLDRFTREGR